jgi:hypothetical protein
MPEHFSSLLHIYGSGQAFMLEKWRRPRWSWRPFQEAKGSVPFAIVKKDDLQTHPTKWLHLQGTDTA